MCGFMYRSSNWFHWSICLLLCQYLCSFYCFKSVVQLEISTSFITHCFIWDWKLSFQDLQRIVLGFWWVGHKQKRVQVTSVLNGHSWSSKTWHLQKESQWRGIEQERSDRWYTSDWPLIQKKGKCMSQYADGSLNYGPGQENSIIAVWCWMSLNPVLRR